jgi:hypothetical protein
MKRISDTNQANPAAGLPQDRILHLPHARVSPRCDVVRDPQQDGTDRQTALWADSDMQMDARPGIKVFVKRSRKIAK